MSSSDYRRGRGVWRTVAAIFLNAVPLNYVWEVAQASLYAGMDDVSRMFWHCFAPSLGDGALALLIFFIGWAALRQRDWFTRPGVRGYALMLVTGLAIAVSVELVAVYTLGQWAYTERMPIVPGFGVGLAPVAQMIILPPIIFRATASWVAQSE